MDVKIFSTLETDDLTQKQNCFNVISLWILSASGKGRFHTGMIFCRYLTLWNGKITLFSEHLPFTDFAMFDLPMAW